MCFISTIPMYLVCFNYSTIFCIVKINFINGEHGLRPPPVADKGSKALFEIMSKRQYIYVQRIATIFQTGGYYPPLRHEWGTVTYRTNKNVDIYCTFVLKYKMKKCVERKR